MVLEIAVGVCLGLVAAVVLLKYWKVILVGLWALIFWAAAIALLITIAVVTWKSLGGRLLALIGAILVLAILAFLASFVHRAIIMFFPSLEAVLKGSAPWDTAARIPIRVLAIGAFVLAVAGICVGVILGIGYLIEAGSQ